MNGFTAANTAIIAGGLKPRPQVQDTKKGDRDAETSPEPFVARFIQPQGRVVILFRKTPVPDETDQ